MSERGKFKLIDEKEQQLNRLVIDMEKNQVIVAGKVLTIDETQYNAIKGVLDAVLDSSPAFESYDIPAYEEYDPNPMATAEAKMKEFGLMP